MRGARRARGVHAAAARDRVLAQPVRGRPWHGLLLFFLVRALCPRQHDEKTTPLSDTTRTPTQHTHQKHSGVVHRDLKLENLLLSKPGQLRGLKIADFGLARRVPGWGGGSGPGGAFGGGAMSTVCGTPQVSLELFPSRERRGG